jgi:hypothetical protein
VTKKYRISNNGNRQSRFAQQINNRQYLVRDSKLDYCYTTVLDRPFGCAQGTARTDMANFNLGFEIWDLGFVYLKIVICRLSG